MTAGKKKPVIWNEISYESIAAAAAANGITHGAMWQRIEAGYTSDRDLYEPVLWNGNQYKNLQEAAIGCGVSHATMRERLQKGYSCDADLKFTRNPGMRKTIHIDQLIEDAVEDYRIQHKLKSWSQAANRLLAIGVQIYQSHAEGSHNPINYDPATDQDDQGEVDSFLGRSNPPKWGGKRKGSGRKS